MCYYLMRYNLDTNKEDFGVDSLRKRGKKMEIMIAFLVGFPFISALLQGLTKNNKTRKIITYASAGAIIFAALKKKKNGKDSRTMNKKNHNLCICRRNYFCGSDVYRNLLHIRRRTNDIQRGNAHRRRTFC